VFHKPKEWEPIWARILEEHGARMAIRWVMQRDLGFTVRHHRALVPNLPALRHHAGGSNMHYEDQIHLDFLQNPHNHGFSCDICSLTDIHSCAIIHVLKQRTIQ
jgi:hypothetical protein